MEKAIVVSGSALILAAVVVLSPFCWSFLKPELAALLAAFGYWADGLPSRSRARWEAAKLSLLGNKTYGTLGLVLAGLSSLGWLWLYNFAHAAPSDGPAAYIVIVIMLGAFGGSLGALALLAQVILDAVGAAFPDHRSVDNDPLGRVGLAAPLGEARLALPHEADAALRGQSAGPFSPPRFED